MISTVHRPRRIYAALLFLIGAALAIGGIRLAALGGSLYYVLAGTLVVASAILLWRGRRLGAWLYVAMLVGTLVWALWEVGLDGWALMPRLLMWIVLGLWLLTPWARRGLTR
jgi:quinoprotein glucose dehydrogenase